MSQYRRCAIQRQQTLAGIVVINTIHPGEMQPEKFDVDFVLAVLLAFYIADMLGFKSLTLKAPATGLFAD